MSTYVIKYYLDDKCVSQFIGDDETLADALFHMNFYSLLPVNFSVTKRNAENREYCLRFIPGGYSWVEVHLNNPQKEMVNGS